MNDRPLFLTPSKDLPKPTYYVSALQGEYSDWAFTEELAPENKGQWREKVFQDTKESQLDLEIGTGNGFHFAHHAKNHPDRNFIGIEIKFKPLIQSIRRAINNGSTNARIIRFDANCVSHLFNKGELNKVFIHFPDPWKKNHQKKHRLIQDSFLNDLYELQAQESYVDFKTDNRDYFDWALKKFQDSSYEVVGLTYNLHHSEFHEENFVTHFESIFLKKGLPIHFLRAQKIKASYKY